MQSNPGPHHSTAERVERFVELVQSATHLASDAVPAVGGRAANGAVQFGQTRRVDRTLDAESLAGELPQMDRVLHAVHDIAVRSFQLLVDRLAGTACALKTENETVAELVTDRSRQFGLGLYFFYRGGCRRVTLEVMDVKPSTRSSDDAKLGGLYVARLIKDPSAVRVDDIKPGHRVCVSAAFPPLIIARTQVEAEAEFRKRVLKSLPPDQTTRGDGNPIP